MKLAPDLSKRPMWGSSSKPTEVTLYPMVRGADWARDYQRIFNFKTHLPRAEWYIQCEYFGWEALRETVEIDPHRRGGTPVLKGTNFTVAQLIAELSETTGPDEIALHFELDVNVIREFLNGLSLLLQKSKSDEHLSVR